MADIKYKLASRKESDPDGAYGRAADYYQLLAYMTALDMDEGTLIYSAQANDIAVKSQDGANLLNSTIAVRNMDKRVHAVAIDLSGSPSDIDDQISALSEHLAGSAGISV